MASTIVQELIYQIGADVSDVKAKAGEARVAIVGLGTAGDDVGHGLAKGFHEGEEGLNQFVTHLREGFETIVKFGEGLILGEIGKKFVEAASESVAALAQISGATGATGEKLAELREQFDKVFTAVPQSNTEVASAISLVVARLGEEGEAAGKTSKQLLDLARVTGSDVGGTIQETTKLLAAFRVGVEDQGAAFDVLLRASQATGTSLGSLTSNLTQAGPFLREFGFSLAQSAAFIGLLEKNGVNASAAIFGLRRAFKEVTDSGGDAQLVFRGIVEQIKGAGSETEAAKLAVDTFGRSAAQMVSVIRSGNFDFDALATRLNTTGDSLTDAADRTDTFVTRMKELGNAIEALAASSGIESFFRSAAKAAADSANTVRAEVEKTSKAQEELSKSGVNFKGLEEGTDNLRIAVRRLIDEGLDPGAAALSALREQDKQISADPADEAAKSYTFLAFSVGEAAANIAAANFKFEAATGTFKAIDDAVANAGETLRQGSAAYSIFADQADRALAAARDAAPGVVSENKKLDESIAKIAAQAQLIGPSFNEAAAVLKAYDEAVAEGVAKHLPLAEAIDRANGRVAEIRASLEGAVPATKAQGEAVGGLAESLGKLPEKVNVGLDASGVETGAETAREALQRLADTKDIDTAFARISVEGKILGTSFVDLSKVASSFPQLAGFLQTDVAFLHQAGQEAAVLTGKLKELADQGKQGTVEFAVIQKQLTGIRDTSSIKLDVDVSAATSRVAQIRSEIEAGLPKAKIDADISAAHDALQTLKKLADTLFPPGSPQRIEYDAKIDAAEAKLNFLKTEAGKGAVIPVDADTSAAQKKFDDLKKQAEDFVRNAPRVSGIGFGPLGQAVAPTLGGTVAFGGVGTSGGDASNFREIRAQVTAFQQQVVAALSSGNRQSLAELLSAGRSFVADFGSSLRKEASNFFGSGGAGGISPQTAGLAAVLADLQRALLALEQAVPRAAFTPGVNDNLTGALGDFFSQQGSRTDETNSLIHTTNDILTSNLSATRSLSSAIKSGGFSTDTLKQQQDAQRLGGVTR